MNSSELLSQVPRSSLGTMEDTPTIETDASTTTTKGSATPCERNNRINPCRAFYRDNPEAIGFAMDSIPRGVAIMGGAVFVSTALLTFAKEAAGCSTSSPNDGDIGDVTTSTLKEECTGRIYGMRPSSLLTTMQTVVAVLVAFLMPIIGAVVDHTRYRREVGAVSAASVTVFVFFQIFMSQRVWFVVAMVQVLVAVAYCAHSTAAFAYLPELTGNAGEVNFDLEDQRIDDDKDMQLKWYGSFTAVQFASTIVFLVVVVSLGAAFGISDDAVSLARLSQSIVFVSCAAFFGYAWTRLFRPRPALQVVPEGSFLLTAGFRKIVKTTQDIRRKYPAVQWTLVGVALSESAVGAFVTIAITYVTDQMLFSSGENGMAILILLVSSMPGSLAGTGISRLVDPRRSLQVCLLLWTVNTFVAAAVLKGPEHRNAAWVLASVWGFATGWYFPAERALYCTIIPPDQNAELMGTYLCACQILGWLPPLVFTAMNEAGVPMKVGLVSLNLYFFGSFLVYFGVGDYKMAVEKARDGIALFAAESSLSSADASHADFPGSEENTAECIKGGNEMDTGGAMKLKGSSSFSTDEKEFNAAEYAENVAEESNSARSDLTRQGGRVKLVSLAVGRMVSLGD